MTENLKKNNFLVEPHETANSFIVKNAMKYIDEHYSEKLNLPEVRYWQAILFPKELPE